jgi:hypothetical protein
VTLLDFAATASTAATRTHLQCAPGRPHILKSTRYIVTSYSQCNRPLTFREFLLLERQPRSTSQEGEGRLEGVGGLEAVWRRAAVEAAAVAIVMRGGDELLLLKKPSFSP